MRKLPWPHSRMLRWVSVWCCHTGVQQPAVCLPLPCRGQYLGVKLGLVGSSGGAIAGSCCLVFVHGEGRASNLGLRQQRALLCLPGGQSWASWKQPSEVLPWCQPLHSAIPHVQPWPLWVWEHFRRPTKGPGVQGTMAALSHVHSAGNEVSHSCPELSLGS